MINRKKVLIVSGVFYPEPIVSARLQTDLAGELAKEYDVTVLRTKPSRPLGFKMPDYDCSIFPFHVVELDSFTSPESSLTGRFHESFSMGRRVCKYINAHHDEIDFVYNDAWHLFGNGQVAKACVKYNIPYITPVQDLYPESLVSKLPKIKILNWLIMKTLMPLDLYNLNHASLIHTNSLKLKEELMASRHLPDDKFVVVRNWQDEKEFIEYASNNGVQNEGGTPFTFMYLGNIGPLAGVDILFDALRMAQLPNARLVVAGSGSAKASLQEKASDFKDCDIEFWDVPIGKVPETQDKADVMCLPVKRGFALSSIPSKLPAYMFSAKPVLASVDKESDTAQCVLRAKGGWVAEPENAESIANAMREAYGTEKNELVAMGKRGFDYSIFHFSRGQNLALLVKACKDIIERKNNG